MTLTRFYLFVAFLTVLIPLVASEQEVQAPYPTSRDAPAKGLAAARSPGAAPRIWRTTYHALTRADLAAHGGHLTGHEYRRLNSRENRLSRRIYSDKHNGVAQPGIVPR